MDFKIFKKKINTLQKKKYKKEKKIKKLLKFFNLTEKKTKKENYKQLYSFLKEQSKTNRELKYFMNSIKRETPHYYKLMVNIMHDLVIPETIFKKYIRDDIYTSLIGKKKKNSLTDDEKAILNDQLHIKFCKCIKKLYLQNLYHKMFFQKEPVYNQYAVCTNSIYKNRNFDVPSRAAIECRKYNWYKN